MKASQFEVFGAEGHGIVEAVGRRTSVEELVTLTVKPVLPVIAESGLGGPPGETSGTGDDRERSG